MADEGWNPWKMTAIGFGLAVGMAVVAGVIVANWSPLEPALKAEAPGRASVPPPVTIDACNQQAAVQTSGTSTTTEIVKDGTTGATPSGGGALYGVNENRKNDEPYRTAYASCMRTRGH